MPYGSCFLAGWAMSTSALVATPTDQNQNCQNGTVSTHCDV